MLSACRNRLQSTRSLSFILILLWLAPAGHAQAPLNQRSIRPLSLNQTRYRLHAGEAASISAPKDTLDFIRDAKHRKVTIRGVEERGLDVGPSVNGNGILLAASLTAKPGEHTVSLSVESDAGDERTATLNVTVEPLQPVPSGATVPPVVLLNGWQSPGLLSSCPISSSAADTFGNLSQYLTQIANVPAVYFFDR